MMHCLSSISTNKIEWSLKRFKHFPAIRRQKQNASCFFKTHIPRTPISPTLGLEHPHHLQQSLSIFTKMRLHDVPPDNRTFPFLLHSLSSLPSALQIHAQVLLFGFHHDAFVQSSLINIYSSCAQVTLARQVFEEITHPDLPSWNSILDAYAKHGLIDAARALFDEMPERNVVSWSCMIKACVACGRCKEALALFREMQRLGDRGVMPNEFTMSSVLLACGRLGALEHGKWAHAYIDRCGMRVDVVVGTALVNMYAKCGSIERARGVFDRMGNCKDVMAWSSMISGLAMHGHAMEALELFAEMGKCGVRPNAVTFVGVLCACVHGGLVYEGRDYFRRMKEEFGVKPMIQHYGCIVDLYGRAGLISDAWKVVISMPMEPDVLVWGALLSGARMHRDIETSEIALNKLIQLDPTNSAAYVLLSNVYAKTGKWSDVRRVRDLMDERGIKKVPGCSLVEIGGVLHEFFVGDDTHPETREIYMMLDEIMTRLKTRGFVGNTSEALLQLDEETKEMALSFHSEKLALAFCFLKTSAGTPIRIVKNLRICSDCHDAMKMVSQEFSREIVIRDCNRFHHFKEGLCSCKDYW